jgi:hypothetical protein
VLSRLKAERTADAVARREDITVARVEMK